MRMVIIILTMYMHRMGKQFFILNNMLLSDIFNIKNSILI